MRHRSGGSVGYDAKGSQETCTVSLDSYRVPVRSPGWKRVSDFQVEKTRIGILIDGAIVKRRLAPPP